MDHISSGALHGRNPKEGYRRAAGLRYHGTAEKVQSQADFQDAASLADGRSVCAPIRLMNLYLLMTHFLPKLEPGNIVEFGSYRGGSAMFMAKLAQIHLPGVQVYALDTYEGMPATDATVDAHKAGDFSGTAFEEVVAAKDAAGLDNLHVVKGLFEDTTPDVIRQSGAIALAHIDCDIYRPAIYAWDQVEPAMVPGGYVVFDDATEPSCLGAMQAVEEIICRHDLRSEQVDPHIVLRFRPLPDA